jgi:hypothetical protein
MESISRLSLDWFHCSRWPISEEDAVAWDPDFEYVCKVQEVLGARADEHGLDSLSEPERVVQLAVWAKGIVDNGAFPYFYEGASNAAQVADAYETLGFNEAAAAFRASLSVFPDGIPQEGHEARCEWMDQNQNVLDHLFSNKLNDPIFALEGQLDKILVAYIRAHRSEFSGIDGLERVFERREEVALPPAEQPVRQTRKTGRLIRRPRR